MRRDLYHIQDFRHDLLKNASTKQFIGQPYASLSTEPQAYEGKTNTYSIAPNTLAFKGGGRDAGIQIVHTAYHLGFGAGSEMEYTYGDIIIRYKIIAMNLRQV